MMLSFVLTDVRIFHSFFFLTGHLLPRGKNERGE